MNIEIGQLKMVLNWYAWELQQIVGRPVSKKQNRWRQSETQNLFYIIFTVLAYV